MASHEIDRTRTSRAEIHALSGVNWGLQYGRRTRGASLGRRLGRRARSRPGGPHRRRSRPSIAGLGRAHAAGPAQADFAVCNRETAGKTVKLIQTFPGSWATNHRNFGNPDQVGADVVFVTRQRTKADCFRWSRLDGMEHLFWCSEHRPRTSKNGLGVFPDSQRTRRRASVKSLG